MPAQNPAQIARIAKGFAPMLGKILEYYIEQNTGSGIAYLTNDGEDEMLWVNNYTQKPGLLEGRCCHPR